jgi:hypothetical protein
LDGEPLAPDFRVNAKNLFGMRGTHYSLWPNKGIGVAFHYSSASSTGEMWPHPYWLSGGGWCIRPFWDHYLVTGDLEFLRKRVVPALKELALFYEDFLTVTDKDGNYIFVPSFSPENNPGNLTPSMMLVINASMDIAVCREVLSNLVQACELLGNDAGSVAKWKAMLAKLPPTCWKRTAPRRNGLGPHWKSVTPIGISLISTGPGQATRSIRTARRNWPGPR